MSLLHTPSSTLAYGTLVLSTEQTNSADFGTKFNVLCFFSEICYILSLLSGFGLFFGVADMAVPPYIELKNMNFISTIWYLESVFGTFCWFDPPTRGIEI